VSVIDDADRGTLQADLDAFNNQSFLVTQAPPVDTANGRHGMGGKEFRRGDAGFDAVLIEKLESSRSIRLIPVGAKPVPSRFAAPSSSTSRSLSSSFTTRCRRRRTLGLAALEQLHTRSTSPRKKSSTPT
jgi:hypothetical protein